MDNQRFLSIRKVTDMLGLSVQTIRRWEKDGKLKVVRSPSNQRLFSVDEVKRLVGLPTGSRVVIYARISSASFRTDWPGSAIAISNGSWVAMASR